MYQVSPMNWIFFMFFTFYILMYIFVFINCFNKTYFWVNLMKKIYVK